MPTDIMMWSSSWHTASTRLTIHLTNIQNVRTHTHRSAQLNSTQFSSVQLFTLISNHPFFRHRPDFHNILYVVFVMLAMPSLLSFSSYVARKLFWIGNKRANDAKFCISCTNNYKIFTRVILRYILYTQSAFSIRIFIVFAVRPARTIMWWPWAIRSTYMFYYMPLIIRIIIIIILVLILFLIIVFAVRPSIRAWRISGWRKCDAGNAITIRSNSEVNLYMVFDISQGKFDSVPTLRDNIHYVKS